MSTIPRLLSGAEVTSRLSAAGFKVDGHSITAPDGFMFAYVDRTDGKEWPEELSDAYVAEYDHRRRLESTISHGVEVASLVYLIKADAMAAAALDSLASGPLKIGTRQTAYFDGDLGIHWLQSSWWEGRAERFIADVLAESPTLATAVQAKAVAAFRPFALLRAQEAMEESARRGGVAWIVRDVIAAGSIAVTYGESGIGKSATVLALAYQCAQARVCNVIYLAFEGSPGLASRVEALRLEYGDVDAAHFVTMPAVANPGDGLDLSTAAGWEALAEMVRRANIIEPSIPVVVVVDSIWSSLSSHQLMTGGGDRFMNGALELSQRTRCAIWALHNANNDGEVFGHHGLHARADYVTKISGRQGGEIRLTRRKNRETLNAATLARFALKTGANGAPVSALKVADIMPQADAAKPKEALAGKDGLTQAKPSPKPLCRL